MNFDFITNNMAVGTTPETPTDVQELIANGITHVLNVRDDVDDWPLLRTTNILYCWNGTPDWNPEAVIGREPKPLVWFQKSLLFWKQYRDDPTFRIFIHCSAGVNRSATTAWMFLRALQLKGRDCDIIIDSHRLIATFGTFFDHPWRMDAESALIQLRYIR